MFASASTPYSSLKDLTEDIQEAKECVEERFPGTAVEYLETILARLALPSPVTDSLGIREAVQC